MSLKIKISRCHNCYAGGNFLIIELGPMPEKSTHPTKFRVVCEKCGVTGPWAEDLAIKAIDKWNYMHKKMEKRYRAKERKEIGRAW